MTDDWSEEQKYQRYVCQVYGAEYQDTGAQDIVIVERAWNNEALPINGFRIARTTEGPQWFIWFGEGDIPDDVGAFEAISAAELIARRDEAGAFLGLASGWRFRNIGSTTNVWFDPVILKW
ncbi:hypothetical protein HNQ07_000962 [Deinococcus metalli]|uniref:Imm33-like domain-containing protein n=1 Tax=Deinococcus metalli TaxID=1141878 RepID=A0A7W8KEB6_9DEIO|nr:hypothetical protein [Deinococcus metalli]MBB5375518.1 hypothetical protein [Deinococcus metalli]GHF28671.1 hypothetical protein GCM10017781_00780 [Deinococcus metalli]